MSSVVASDRPSTASRSVRPAVVESVDSPQSISDGRAATPEPAIWAQVGRFVAIGLVSTLAWAGLFLLLRGAGLGSVAGNGVALVVTAIGNTAANRRFTFGRTGRAGLARDHGAGLLAFLVALAITTSAAGILGRLAPGAGRPIEIAVLAAANLAATATRFLLLRTLTGTGRSPLGAALPPGADRAGRSPLGAALPPALSRHLGRP